MTNNQKMYRYMDTGFVVNMDEVTNIVMASLPNGMTEQQIKQKIEFEKQNIEKAMYAQNDLQFVLRFFDDWRWNDIKIKPYQTCSVALAKGLGQYFSENSRFGSYLGHVDAAFEEVNDIYDFSSTNMQLDEKAPESAIITRSVMDGFKRHRREIDNCVREWGPYEGAADARDLEDNFRVTALDVCHQIGERHSWGNFKSYAKGFGVPVEALTTMCQPMIDIYTGEQNRQKKKQKDAERWAAHNLIWGK